MAQWQQLLVAVVARWSIDLFWVSHLDHGGRVCNTQDSILTPWDDFPSRGSSKLWGVHTQPKRRLIGNVFSTKPEKSMSVC